MQKGKVNQVEGLIPGLVGWHAKGGRWEAEKRQEDPRDGGRGPKKFALRGEKRGNKPPVRSEERQKLSSLN